MLRPRCFALVSTLLVLSAVALSACKNEKAALVDRIREGVPSECAVYDPTEDRNSIDIQCNLSTSLSTTGPRVQSECAEIRRLGIGAVNFTFSDHAPIAMGSAEIEAGCQVPAL